MFGKTPLHYAASAGNVEATQLLLPLHSGTGAKDCNGLTAADCALMEGHKKVAHLIATHFRLVMAEEWKSSQHMWLNFYHCHSIESMVSGHHDKKVMVYE